MAWVGVVTNAGAQLFANYSQSGQTLSVNCVKCGSGSVQQSDMRGRTSLVSYVDDGTVESQVIQGNSVVYRLRANPASSSSYTLTEMGLFLDATASGQTTTVMVAYFLEVDGGITVPLASSFPDFAYILVSSLAIANDVNITFTVNPAAFVSNSTMNTELAKKLDVNQGSGNAGKFMIVASDGTITPTTVPFAEGSEF